MILIHKKKTVFEGTKLDNLNNFIFSSNYGILKNIKTLKTFDNDILISNSEIKLTAFILMIPKFKTKVPQMLEFWYERGWSEEEAKEKIAAIKNLQKNGIYAKITPEKRKEQAINANKKRVSQMKKLKISDPQKLKEKSNTNIEYYLAKGLNLEEAENALKERQATFSKKKMIEKFGEEEGLKKVAERNSKWFSSLKENNDWEELSKRKIMTLEKCILNYGTEEGVEKFKTANAAKAQTKENYIKKFGVEEGEMKWSSYVKKRAERSITYYSKEACLFFKPFLEKLNSGELIVYTANENFGKEYFLLRDNKIHFYDFTVPALKLIIEYHGVHIHPNPTWKSEKWYAWKHAFNGKSANEARAFDLRKKEIAEQSGFTVVEIWNDSTKEENTKKIDCIINDKLDIMYNTKNGNALTT